MQQAQCLPVCRPGRHSPLLSAVQAAKLAYAQCTPQNKAGSNPHLVRLCGQQQQLGSDAPLGGHRGQAPDACLDCKGLRQGLQIARHGLEEGATQVSSMPNFTNAIQCTAVTHCREMPGHEVPMSWSTLLQWAKATILVRDICCDCCRHARAVLFEPSQS